MTKKIPGTKIFSRSSKFEAIKDKGVFKSITPMQPPYIDEKNCEELNNTYYHKVKHGLPSIRIHFYNVVSYQQDTNDNFFKKSPKENGKEFHQLPSFNDTKLVTLRPLSLGAGAEMHVETGYKGANKLSHYINYKEIIDVYTTFYYNYEAALLAEMINNEDIKYYNCIPKKELPSVFKELFVSLLKYALGQCNSEIISFDNLEFYFHRLTDLSLLAEIKKYSLEIYINKVVDDKVIIRSQVGFALEKRNAMALQVGSNEECKMECDDGNSSKCKKKKKIDDEIIIDLTTEH